MYEIIDEEQATSLISDLIELNDSIELGQDQLEYAKSELIGMEMLDDEGLNLTPYTQTKHGETIYQLRIGGIFAMRHVCYL